MMQAVKIRAALRRWKCMGSCMVGLLYALTIRAQGVVPVAGMHINASIKLAPGVYKLNNGAQPVIEIAGNNIVVDGNHAILDGNTGGTQPDGFSGVALRIVSGKNITLKNLTAKGFKIALMAKGITGLIIENCDFSYNYRQHLNSTQQKEDLGDWMSYHHNENDEWQRYGAAIYLRECAKAVVHDNKVTGGQCALMLTLCDSGMFYNNAFSFNSGLGIGMYRSNGNKIFYNQLDFNVRGHSEGVYNRGQDAAAILVFEQCNGNKFVNNSATHSGDGFFLWAGQTTMDNGTGGCNDNLIFANDFSYAPTNGIEVTFSRNQIFGNIIHGCDNGIWGGYSYQSKIGGNEFSKNKVAIAIEHGQQNEILFNTFEHDETGVKLWARKQSPPDWGYSKNRDTRSVDYLIAGNRFSKINNAVTVAVTDTLRIGLNQFNNCTKNIVAGELVNEMDTAWNCKDSLQAKFNMPVYTAIPESIKPAFKKAKFAGNGDRSQIRMTEWGPYDFRSPLIWNTNPAALSDTMQFEIIGPKGNWKIVNQRGVKNISSATGAVPAVISAIKTNEKGQDLFIELEYTGTPITTLLGKKIKKGIPSRFNYRNPVLPANWLVNWYAFDSLQNPVTDSSRLPELVKQPPVLTEQTNDLHYAWWSGVGKEKKYEQFITVAESDINFPEGSYTMGVSWEDVVRIYIDGQLVLDEWKPAPHQYDESPHREMPVNLAGKHHLRVVHANQGGFATLIIKLKKK